jgi:hypothetical protein
MRGTLADAGTPATADCTVLRDARRGVKRLTTGVFRSTIAINVALSGRRPGIHAKAGGPSLAFSNQKDWNDKDWRKSGGRKREGDA